MGLRINTNVPSIAAQRTAGLVMEQQSSSLSKLSSGQRINRASDDAAGLAISEKLKASIKSTNQANRNANDAISMIQTAEGSLSEIGNILIRLRELSIQSSSDTVGDSERQFSELEFQNLKQEIERIAQSTEFNGKKMLNGAQDKYEFQIGINNVPFEDRIIFEANKSNATLSNLGLTELSVGNKESSREGLMKLDTAMSWISGQRSNLGAIQNSLTSTSNNLAVNMENMSVANSRIRDTDFASETANNVRLNILTQAGTSVLAQANNQGAAVLKLLNT